MCLTTKETRKKRRKRLRTSICPKCLQLRELERHHIYPARFFGKGKQNHYILYLCTDCHREGRNSIGDMLPRHFQLSKGEYNRLHRAWFRGETITVIGREVA